MNIVLPGLLWPFIGDVDYLYPQIKMDYFNQLIKKSTVKKHNNIKYSDFVYGSIYKVNNQSLANHIAKLNNLLDQHPYFLIIEPTNLRIDRDRLLICEPELLQLDNEEEQLIIEAINQHFQNEIVIYCISNGFWLLGINESLSEANQIKTKDTSGHYFPLIDIVGKNIDDYLPKDTDGITFSKLLNEIQMLLFSLPLNKMRKSEGLLTVNSVWIWDTLIQPTVLSCEVENTILTNNKILLSGNNKHIRELSENFSLPDKNSLILIDSLYYPCAYADSSNFIRILEIFDNKVAFELSKRLRHGKINHINLFIPQQDNTIEIIITNLDKYKFWRNNTFPKIIKDIQ